MKADLVIKSNAIFDSVGDSPFQGYVAIKNNRIVSVGQDGKADDWIENETKVYDYKDKLVMPAFHDSHTHLLLAGMYKTYVNLGDAKSEEEAAKMVKDFYEENPKDGWILGLTGTISFGIKKNRQQKNP